MGFKICFILAYKELDKTDSVTTKNLKKFVSYLERYDGELPDELTSIEHLKVILAKIIRFISFKYISVFEGTVAAATAEEEFDALIDEIHENCNSLFEDTFCIETERTQTNIHCIDRDIEEKMVNKNETDDMTFDGNSTGDSIRSESCPENTEENTNTFTNFVLTKNYKKSTFNQIEVF